MNRPRLCKLAGASVLVGALAAGVTPALAASSGSVAVTYGASVGCSSCRTLVLSNYDGSALTGLDLSSGSNGFLADVQDTGIDPAVLGNFSVGSTMSNLYAYDSKAGTYNCNVSIPSSEIQLNSAPALLDASNMSASLQPIFKITGDISSLITSAVTAALPGTTVTVTPVIDGVQGATETALDQAAEAGGSTLTNLTGSLLSGLPVNLTSGTGGAFTTAAAPPPGSGCTGNGTGATSVPVLNGALPASSPLLTDEQNQVGSPTVTQMIADGYLTASTAETLISQATGIPAADFDLTTAPFGGLLTSIEGKLTGAVTGLVSSATSISGNYGGQPVMAISAPSATPASYQGVLTVTLTSS